MGNKILKHVAQNKQKNTNSKKTDKHEWEMQQEQRCLSDIKQFYENVDEAKKAGANDKIIDLAQRYCEDTKFFLQKKDYVTAFGAINYAHGLIDAYRKSYLE